MHLKRSAAITLLFALLTQTSEAQATVPKIFRYISVEPFGRIELGDTLDPRSELGVFVAPDVVRLERKDGRPIQLADTKSILLALSKRRTVCAMVFVYLPTSTFRGAVADYRSSLGAPVLEEHTERGVIVHSARWQDPHTSFVLEEHFSEGQLALSSRLEHRPFTGVETCRQP